MAGTESVNEPERSEGEIPPLYRRILEFVPAGTVADARGPDTSWTTRSKAAFDTTDLYGDP